jgi:hypothetical protein
MSPRWATILVVAACLAGPSALAGPAAGADAVRADAVSPTAVVTTREVVGTSVEGRPIVALHRARPGATRTVLVIGNVHGDEQAGLRVVRRLRDRAHLPADLDLWLVLTANPDGTAADRRTNAHGVDLNRNFPYLWHTSARGSTWSGRAPLSEPESQTLKALIRRLHPVLTVVFHQPLFGVGSSDKGMASVRAVARGMKLPIQNLACTGVCHGSFGSWVNHRTPYLAVTVEFGHKVADWRIRRAAATVVSVGSRLD